MHRFIPSRKIPSGELLLVPEALWRLFLARLQISFRSPEAYLPDLHKPRNVFLKNSNPDDRVIRITNTIRGISRRTPWKSTCLVIALAAHHMFTKRKIEHLVHLGVGRETGNKMKAHAWVSVGGTVILGGGNLEQFHEISRFG